jgi:RNA polymerase sigma-70 factor, ECF subfamily
VVQDAAVTDARAGLERVYRDESATMWRSLAAYTHDPEIASDALAEAFAQALAAGERIRSPSAWIWHVAFRIAAGELKRTRQVPETVSVPSYDPPEPVDHLIDALANLSPNQRLAIVLHDYADRPTDEIARTMGVTRATVHVHLSNARRRLRRLLEDDDG